MTKLDLAAQLRRHVLAHVLEPRTVFPEIDETVMDGGRQRIARGIAVAEERQEQCSHYQQQRQGDAAAIGQVAQGLFMEEGAKNWPAEARKRRVRMADGGWRIGRRLRIAGFLGDWSFLLNLQV